MKLYNQILIDHYHNPKNYKKLKFFDFESMAFNPLCGDKISLEVKFNGEIISDIGFQGEGCIISLATASILFDTVMNQNIKYIDLLSEKDILNLIKMDLGVNRLKCALLPLEALKIMVEKYKLNLCK